VKLFAGLDLVRFFRELRLIRGEQISPDWLAAVII
jgi:hypothetical protein